MSKVKPDGLTHYEILFIVPNNFTEEEAKKINEHVKKTIEDNAGKVTFSQYWGKKKLAYQIKQFNHGYFALYEFDLEGRNLEKLDRTLRLSNEVLRHQIVKKKLVTEEERKKNEKIAEKIAEKKIEEVKEKEEKAEIKKKDESKVDLKDLDKKLEDILNTGDLL